MSRYDTGRHVEHCNRHHLEFDGYKVTRSAGSKGVYDLHAIKPGQQLFIQSKLAHGQLSGANWNRLCEHASWVGAIPVLGIRDTKVGCQEFHKSGKCGTVLYRLTGPYIPQRGFFQQPAELFVTDELTSSPDGPGGAETHRVTCGVGLSAKEQGSACIDSGRGTYRGASAHGAAPVEGGAS